MTKGYEKIKDPKGRGELSVSRIEEHIQLTPPEKDIILFHMGFAALDMADSKRKVKS